MEKGQKLGIDEQELLKKHYRQARSALIRDRAHAILLSNQGRDINDIASIMMRHRETIKGWLDDFEGGRISSIFHRYTGNDNASKLTKEQRKEITKVLSQEPSEQGLSKKFWDVPSLQQYIKGAFGIVYESERSYHYLLQYEGYSWKLPSPFDIKRDESYIEKRMKEISQEIQPYLDDNDWLVFTADEARITWEEEIRRAWLKRNKKTVVKVSRDQTHQHYFGALELKSKKEHIISLEWQNTDTMIYALTRLTKKYPDKKICIIWDNAKWHKAKALREKLRKNEPLENIHLVNFPPYAPDMNPQEHIWKFGKDHIANTHFDTFDNMKSIFNKALNNKSFDYKIPEFVLR